MESRQKKRSTLFAAYLMTWSAIPHVLFSRKRPVSTLAWVWSIIALPFAGPLAYFMFGADRMQRKRLKKAARLGVLHRRTSGHKPDAARDFSARKQELLQVLGAVNQIPTATARRVQLLVDAVQFYPELECRIAAARHHIHVEFFIWRDDEIGKRFLGLLTDAARRGVKVRLLLDQFGCLGMRKSVFAPLVEAGGHFSWFYSLPLWRHSRFMNLRNHRKLQIIDGAAAFVGGMNIGREYLLGYQKTGPWRDAQMLVEGSVVRNLQQIFAEDWFFATDERFSGHDYYPGHAGAEPHILQVISGGPDLPREPVPKSMLALLSAARTRVWMTTGYFVPTQLFLTGLQLCAARGIDVRLLISEKSDHPYLVQIGRSFYEELLEWGVRVFEYNSGINHKKTMLLDEEWLMVGSANSDNRSMRLNFELNVLAHAPEQAAELAQLLTREFDESTEIKLEEFRNRPFRRRLLEAALRPFRRCFEPRSGPR